IPIDEILCRELAMLALTRMKNPDTISNHVQAVIASYDICNTAPEKIYVPTCIIHSDDDPVIPFEHATALHHKIKHSTLNIISGFGHSFANRQFFDPICHSIKEVSSSVKLKK